MPARAQEHDHGVYSGPELQSYGTEGKSCHLGRNFASYGAREWHSSQPGTLKLRDIDFYFPRFFLFSRNFRVTLHSWVFPGLTCKSRVWLLVLLVSTVVVMRG